MFTDHIACYEAIGKALVSASPRGWSKIDVDVTLDGDRTDIVVACHRSRLGAPTHLVGVPMLASYFHELAELVSTKDKGLYKTCKFTLDADGKFDAKFSY